MKHWLWFLVALSFAFASLSGCRRYDSPPMQMAPGQQVPAGDDSLSVEEFLALPSLEQVERREDANRHLSEARDVEHYMRRFVDKSKYWDYAFRNNPREVGIGVTTCLLELDEATRIDPTNFSAWCLQAEISALVGDWGTTRLALQGAVEARKLLPEAEQPAARVRIATAQAWLCKDLGLWDEGLSVVAEGLAIAPQDQELHLIKGLLLAGSGHFVEAIRQAMRLKPIEYPRIMYRMYGVSKNRSIYGSQWIQAMAYLAIGETELAFYALGPLNPHRQQIPYMSRYWNDVGLICELGGLDDEAHLYYGMAYVCQPMRFFFPSFGYSCSPKIFGEPKLKTPCWVSYGRYFLAGSLFTYSSQVAAEFMGVSDPQERERLGPLARKSLSLCMRRGIRPTLAQALRGRVLFAQEQYETAEPDLLAADRSFALQERTDPVTSLLLGVLRLRREQFAAAVPYLQRAVAADSSLGAGWRSLGVALIHVGDPGAGRVALDRAITLQPHSAVARYNRGLLNFQEGRLDEALWDLQLAASERPDDKDIAKLMSRVNQEWRLAGGGVSDEELQERVIVTVAARSEGTDSGGTVADAPVGSADGETGTAGPDDAETPASLVAGREESLLAWTFPSPPQDTTTGLVPAEEHLEAGDYEAIIPELVAAFAIEPSPATREELARAYVRSWQPEQALDILLPHWPDDMSAGEMRLVIEADRALGNTSRALLAIQTDLEETPLMEDPVYWALVAFTLLESGYRREGFAALDVAIDQEYTLGLDEYFMRRSASMFVSTSQATRHNSLKTFKELHRLEYESRLAEGGRGYNAAEQTGKKPQ